MEVKTDKPMLERKIYGKTGEIGKDGLLTREQQALLNQIQERAAINSLNYLDNMREGDPSPMVAMATGIGKGNIIHRIIELQMRKNKDEKVLLIAGTKLVLVQQTHEKLEEYKYYPGKSLYVETEEEDRLTEETTSIENNPLENQKSFFYKTGRIGRQDVNVHVATIQTVLSAINKEKVNPDGYGLAIVDEVHNIGTLKRKTVVDKFERRIGFTATPYRHSGEMKSPTEYGFIIIESLSLPEAQKLRILPPLLGMQVDTKGIVDEIPVTLTGKINYPKLEKLLKDSPNLRPFIAGRVSELISEGGRKYKTIVVVNFVWEAEELAKLFHDRGIKVGIAVNNQASKAIHTQEIPALDSINRYKLPDENPQSIQVLISPYVASEGFDAPTTEVLVWASPTDSSLRYTQYTGRLARRNEGKLFGIIVDFIYQTSQYGWSYNMGMWMKNDVKQLDNGLLWLGPESDIQSLKQLKQVEAIRQKADVKSLSDLQKGSLLDIQETDFALTQRNLMATFVGGAKRLNALSQEVLKEIKSVNSELVVKRTNETRIINAIIDRQIFIDAMLKKGAVLKTSEIEAANVAGFMVTKRNLEVTFVGGHEKLRPLAEQVIRELREEDPNLIIRMRKPPMIINHIRNKQLFIDAMLKKGAVLKSSEIEKVKETDFVLSIPSITTTFMGNNSKLYSLAQEVLEEIQSEHPELVVKRTTGGQIVNAIIERQEFIDSMLAKGAKLRNK